VLTNVIIRNTIQLNLTGREKIKEKEEDMGNLAKIAKELYSDGMKEGKTEYIKRILSKKLNLFPGEEIEVLMEETSVEKLDEIGDKVFEINSWEEVYVILKKDM